MPRELLTTDMYRDFHLKVTYRVAGPANTGSGFGIIGGQAYQRDISNTATRLRIPDIYCPARCSWRST